MKLDIPIFKKTIIVTLAFQLIFVVVGVALYWIGGGKINRCEELKETILACLIPPFALWLLAVPIVAVDFEWG